MVLLLDEIHFANYGTYNPANERANERTNERSTEPGALVQGRFGMLITDQHTYPSPAPASPTSHPPGRELPRLPADSSWNGPHRRSRCTQGSRETDESTLRPENAEKRSFCPLSSSLREQRGEERTRLAPIYAARLFF